MVLLVATDLLERVGEVIVLVLDELASGEVGDCAQSFGISGAELDRERRDRADGLRQVPVSTCGTVSL